MLIPMTAHVLGVNKNVNFFARNVYGKVYFWSSVNKNVNFLLRKVYEKVYGAKISLREVIPA